MVCSHCNLAAHLDPQGYTDTGSAIMALHQHADRVKRFLGIDPDENRLHDAALYDDGSYVEEEPSVKDFLLDLVPTGPRIVHYLRELFPFLNWIFHYNLTWLFGDFIAGEYRAQERKGFPQGHG
jgi:hypothetical protein